MSLTATQYPVVTRREASTLAAAREALAAISERAGANACRSAGGDTAAAARLAEATGRAREGLTHALIIASVYAGSERADALLRSQWGKEAEDAS